MLLSIYKSWEIEEFACFYTFSKELDQLFYETLWDIDRDDPIFEGHLRPYTPPGAFDLTSRGQFDIPFLFLPPRYYYISSIMLLFKYKK